jgi:hypothetical protein
VSGTSCLLCTRALRAGQVVCGVVGLSIQSGIVCVGEGTALAIARDMPAAPIYMSTLCNWREGSGVTGWCTQWGFDVDASVLRLQAELFSLFRADVVKAAPDL